MLKMDSRRGKISITLLNMRKVLEQPGHFAWQVFDSKVLTYFMKNIDLRCSFCRGNYWWQLKMDNIDSETKTIRI